MHLVVGGASAGKRAWVKKHFPHHTWVSAYEGAHYLQVDERWEKGTALVLEGWEHWIQADLIQADLIRADLFGRVQPEARSNRRLRAAQDYRENAVDSIRAHYASYWQRLRSERDMTVVLIMLEMGRGIVPLDAEERQWRDVCGWILQDAAREASTVYYVWHGLVHKIKGTGV